MYETIQCFGFRDDENTLNALKGGCTAEVFYWPRQPGYAQSWD
jgi:hypothetical protein